MSDDIFGDSFEDFLSGRLSESAQRAASLSAPPAAASVGCGPKDTSTSSKANVALAVSSSTTVNHHDHDGVGSAGSGAAGFAVSHATPLRSLNNESLSSPFDEALTTLASPPPSAAGLWGRTTAEAVRMAGADSPHVADGHAARTQQPVAVVDAANAASSPLPSLSNQHEQQQNGVPTPAVAEAADEGGREGLSHSAVAEAEAEGGAKQREGTLRSAVADRYAQLFSTDALARPRATVAGPTLNAARHVADRMAEHARRGIAIAATTFAKDAAAAASSAAASAVGGGGGEASAAVAGFGMVGSAAPPPLLRMAAAGDTAAGAAVGRIRHAFSAAASSKARGRGRGQPYGSSAVISVEVSEAELSSASSDSASSGPSSSPPAAALPPRAGGGEGEPFARGGGGGGRGGGASDAASQKSPLVTERFYIRDQIGRAFRLKKTALRRPSAPANVAVYGATAAVTAAAGPSPSFGTAEGATIPTPSLSSTSPTSPASSRQQHRHATEEKEGGGDDDDTVVGLFTASEKERFATARTLARHPLLASLPLLSPLANTFGISATLALGLCYFFGKGLGSHMMASGALPIFKDVFKVSSTQFQAYSTLMDLGWSAKPIVGLLSDLVLLRGEHKRGWLTIAVALSVTFSLIFAMLPAPPSSSSAASPTISPEDAAFYASMASVAAVCGFFVSFGFATVDLLLEGFYCELMQLCPAKGSMLVSWVWMGIMAGGVVAACLEGPIADHFNPKICLVISGLAAAIVGVPIVRNWIGEGRFVRYPPLDASSSSSSRVVANATSEKNEAKFQGQQGGVSRTASRPQTPQVASLAQPSASSAAATPPSLALGGPTSTTSSAAGGGSGGDLVLVEFADVDDAHAFATRRRTNFVGGGGKDKGSQRGSAAGLNESDDDSAEEMRRNAYSLDNGDEAEEEEEGLLGQGERVSEDEDEEGAAAANAQQAIVTMPNHGSSLRRRRRRSSDGSVGSARRCPRGGIAECVSVGALAPPCLHLDSFLAASSSSSSPSAVSGAGGGYTYLGSGRGGYGGVRGTFSRLMARFRAFARRTEVALRPDWAAVPPSSLLIVLTAKARQHKAIVGYAALMGVTSIAMALSTMSFSIAASGDSAANGALSPEDREARILRGRMQLAAVATTAILLLSTASFYCLPSVIACANLFMCLKELFYVRIGGPMDYFYTATPDCLVNGPHFSYSYYQSFTAIVGYGAGAAGVSIFYRFFSKRSIRRTFFITTAIKILASVVDLVLVNRWNITHLSRLPFPLSYVFSHDKGVYLFGDAIIFQAVQMLDFMPMVLLTSKMCPKGLECTTYAILAGFSNFGGVLSNTLGSLLIAFVFPIRTTKPADWAPGGGSEAKYPNGYCDFSNLSSLLTLCHFVMPLATLVLIPILLPDHRMDEDVLACAVVAEAPLAAEAASADAADIREDGDRDAVVVEAGSRE